MEGQSGSGLFPNSWESRQGFYKVINGLGVGRHFFKSKFQNLPLKRDQMNVKFQNREFNDLSFGFDLTLIHIRFITPCELWHLTFIHAEKGFSNP
jgi:hypothetical protein